MKKDELESLAKYFNINTSKFIRFSSMATQKLLEEQTPYEECLSTLKKIWEDIFGNSKVFLYSYYIIIERLCAEIEEARIRNIFKKKGGSAFA
ncbi:MAG: hypothetical protein ACI9AR_000520 [Flavobacteriaceae bacterium]|jgi:hypothetical protein